MMHIHGRQMKGLFDDRASCLFDLVSVITHINCMGMAGFCHFLPLIAVLWRLLLMPVVMALGTFGFWMQNSSFTFTV